MPVTSVGRSGPADGYVEEDDLPIVFGQEYPGAGSSPVSVDDRTRDCAASPANE